MNSAEEIKATVKKKYGEIAKQSRLQNLTSCCGAGECASVDYTIFSEDYSQVAGYHPDADLGLGCGLPTEHANIQAGNTVLDLGSGAGNDVFVARSIVGETGKVIGIDMTEAMLAKARHNNEKRGYQNVEFRLGEIEALPIETGSIDVVISNCVLNLVPNKAQAYAEIYRVLNPQGHFCISDVVIVGKLPVTLQSAAEMYVGCVAGAMEKEAYLATIKEAGFTHISLPKEKTITIPDEILLQYITAEEVMEFKQSGNAILSITVYGEK